MMVRGRFPDIDDIKALARGHVWRGHVLEAAPQSVLAGADRTRCCQYAFGVKWALSAVKSVTLVIIFKPVKLDWPIEISDVFLRKLTGNDCG